MAVTSSSPPPPRSGRGGSDFSLWLGFAGVWLAVLAFWPPFWAVNGGYSVLGLEVIARQFNEAGRLAWAWISLLTFRVPIPDLPGISEVQPVLPWLGVLAASILQVVLVVRRALKMPTPSILWVAGTVLSIYDGGTTFFGLGTVRWIQAAGGAGLIIQAILTAILTFTGELSVGLLVKRTVIALRRR